MKGKYLLILFILFIVIPVVVRLASREGMCTDDIYNMVKQKMNNEAITVKINSDCDSNYYDYILIKLGLKTVDLKTATVPVSPASCPKEGIKCIADFGTSIGDPLCCGQSGVLQDTRYVCPNTLQKCSNFKCGSAFGTCSK
jgi:hypothetical protein